MVELNFEVNADAVTDRTFGPIPPGEYAGEIVAADVKTSAAGHQYLSVQVQIEGKGSVWDNLNLWHPSSSAVEVATRKLTQIGLAIGVPKIHDTDELLAKRVRVRVGLQKKDPERNDILDYLAGAPSPSPAAPPPSASSAPAWRA
jgi:hypothetical protein